MIKQILLFSSLFLSASAFAQNIDKYTISGEIEGVKKGTAYLMTRTATDQKIDSAIIVNGKFSLSDTISSPGISTLIIANDTLDRSRSMLVREKGNILVKGKAENLANLKITGTKSNDVLTKFDEESNYGNPDWMAEFEEKYRAAQESLNDSLVSVYEDEYEANAKNNAKIAAKLIKANAGSYAAPILLSLNMTSLDIADADNLLKEIEKSAIQYPMNERLRSVINAKLKTAPGQIAPEIVMKDTTQTKDLKLSSLRGKYVLIDFWASWCGPCRAENPNVVAAYEKFKNKNFTIFSVSLDRDKANWLKAIKADNLSWPYHVSDLQYWNNEAAKEYGVGGIPANFLIDPQGKIIASDLRGKALENKLEEILK